MTRRAFAFLLAAHAVGCAAVRAPNPVDVSADNPVSAKTMNLARLNGARLYASAAVEGYPPLALVDGVRNVAVWEPGAGWELAFDGAFLRNRSFAPSPDPAAREPLEWAGLRRDFRAGKEHSALGWIILELPAKRTVNELGIYSVDTPDYPAARFGVRDALIEVWDEPTERWVRVVPIRGNPTKRNTVEDNSLAELRVRFQPARTDLVRVAIRWTNDARQTRSLTVMGRREEYAQATIRLTELEINGVPESGDAIAEVARQSIPSSPSDAEVAENAATADAAIHEVARQYLNAFAEHDLDALMETIAPDYLSEGEDRAELRSRLRNTFEEFPFFLFTYSPPRSDAAGSDSAVVAVEYTLRLSPLLPRASRGSLVFSLIKAGNAWLIQETQTIAR